LRPGAYASTEVSVPIPGAWRLQVGVRSTEFDIDHVSAEVTIG
jgi:hypothetical protein